MVTPIQCLRRKKNPIGRGGTQQNSSLEHLSPPISSKDNTNNANNNNNNGGGGGRTTRNGGQQRNNNCGGGGRQQQQQLRRAPTPPPPEESTLQSHPRLSRIMEEAQYEAYVDPFRGILPFFSLSYNNDDNNNDEGGGVSNIDNNIDTQSPWVPCESVLQGECTSWKFEQGDDVDTTKKMSYKKQQQQKKGVKKQQQKVEIVNVDDDDNDDSSSVVDVQQLKNNNSSGSNDNNNDESKVRIVQCGCTTIDAWAIEEWERYYLQLSKTKKNKKAGGMKRKRKNTSTVDVDMEEGTDLSCDDNNVGTINDDDNNDDDDAAEKKNDVNSSSSLAAITPILICGQRKLDGDECCPCDFNPVREASLLVRKTLILFQFIKIIILLFAHFPHFPPLKFTFVSLLLSVLLGIIGWYFGSVPIQCCKN